MNVLLHIERLVLDGFAVTPAQRRSFVNAAQAELGRLLASQGVPREMSAGYATPAVDGGQVQCAPVGFEPARFGTEVARAVYRGLGGPAE